MSTDPTPYYIIPAIEEFKHAEGDRRVQLAARIALAIGNPVALRTVLGISPEEFKNFYPDMVLPQLSTDDTIDTFIDKFGDPAVKEKNELDDIIAPAAVYNINSLTDLPEIEGVDASDIPNFDIPAVAKKDTQSTSASETDTMDKRAPAPSIADLEEKLKVLVKNRDYQGAIDTIMEINLNNPKKSVYFADQIRFLKKLIEISN